MTKKGKAKPKISWKCRENCPYHCVLVMFDEEGKLDKKYELETFAHRCPFTVEDVEVSFDGEADRDG